MKNTLISSCPSCLYAGRVVLETGAPRVVDRIEMNFAQETGCRRCVKAAVDTSAMRALSERKCGVCEAPNRFRVGHIGQERTRIEWGGSKKSRAPRVAARRPCCVIGKHRGPASRLGAPRNLAARCSEHRRPAMEPRGRSGSLSRGRLPGPNRTDRCLAPLQLHQASERDPS